MSNNVLKITLLLSLLLNATFAYVFTAKDVAIAPSQTEIKETTETKQVKDTTVYESGHTYPLMRIVDGDTIIVGFEGSTEYIRLIGINAPELNDPGSTQCFAEESMKHLQEIAQTGLVILRFDETQGLRDTYGRLLAYVEIPESSVDLGKQMLTDGFAREYTFKNIDYAKKEEYKIAEQNAVNEKKGLWSETICKQ